jgi:4-amino-4-deoxychorismate lyase
MKLLLNGVLYESTEAVVSVFDHGFLYGIGMFETFRTYKGEPFLLVEHLERLASGCRELQIGVTWSQEEIRNQVRILLEANHLDDAYFRLSVSAGEDILGLPTGAYLKPNVILYIKPLPKRDETIYQQGKPLQQLTLNRNTPEGSHRLKSFHYMNNILAKQEMANYPWAAQAEGIFINKDGFLAEGVVSNLFWIKDGILRTPSIDTGILPGITRQYVLQIAKSFGLGIEEGHWRWSQLELADEVFTTNSIQEIVPANGFFDQKGQFTPFGRPFEVGCVTSKLMSNYRS